MIVATARARCFLALLALAAIGFGPLSITALIGMVVVLKRPAWFLRLTLEVYGDQHLGGGAVPTPEPLTALDTRLRVLAMLTALMILDIAPVPVVGSIGLWVVAARPSGFLRLVKRVYGIA